MGSWHRENPELVGTDSDPWMQHESYRRAMAETPRVCEGCLRSARHLDHRNLCPRCVWIDDQENP